MKRVLFLLFFTYQHASTLGQLVLGSSPSIDDLQIGIASQPLDVFLISASTEGWNPPVIYSRWHIENVAANVDKAAMQSAHEFGKAVAIRIAVETRRVPFPTTTNEARLFSKAYLDLADWLNRSKGYGNIILGARCLDIAAVGIGRCAIDPAFSQKDLTHLVSRLRPRWLDPQVRKDILNEEAGAPLFSVDEKGGASDIVETLNTVWQTGQTQALEKRNPALKSIRIKKHEDLNVSSKTRASEVAYFDHPAIIANLPFFADDSLRGSVTTVETWGKKQHGHVVATLESANVAKVEALATFREKVGGFPTNYAVQHPFYTGAKAAFELAWRPHATKETRLLYVTAWQAYDELTNGTFLDQETRLCRDAQPAGVTP